jgi:hypothetical protein
VVIAKKQDDSDQGMGALKGRVSGTEEGWRNHKCGDC